MNKINKQGKMNERDERDNKPDGLSSITVDFHFPYLFVSLAKKLTERIWKTGDSGKAKFFCFSTTVTPMRSFSHVT